MILKTNLKGQVRQTPLPKWRALLPLFEAIMNSYQAIQEADPERSHSITVVCEREQTLSLADEAAPFDKFVIRDTGVGFNDANFDSFNTAFSEYKYERGGKGLGRMLWLKAFEKAEISSVFREADSGHPWKREFTFDTGYDPDRAPASPIEEGQVGTTITLAGYRTPYKEECPRAIEVLAQRVIEHFVLILLRSDAPKIELIADGIRHSINDLFRRTYQENAFESRFEVNGSEFVMHGFKLTSPRAARHRLIYAANSRGVLTENLDDHIPNLSSRLLEDNGETFVFLAIVQGAYLDGKVNISRTDFDIGATASSEETGEQLSFMPPEIISRADIRNECIKAVNSALSPYILALNEAKVEKINRYVRDEAPQYKPIMRYRSEFIDQISPNATKIEMEMALHRELHNREVEIKKESSRMITGAEKIDDYETYREKITDFIERYSELGTAALAHHVMHRRIIIDFLERAISVNEKTGKYPLEEVVHNIIFPMRSSDQDTLYSQQNLWLLDERLTFHTHIASDKKLSATRGLESSSPLRPDLFIFDRQIAFSEAVEDGSPINSVVVVEFKKPQRDNYRDEKNPLDQVFEQIKEIRSGTFLNEAGRPIRTANTKIPAFAYVVCDITPRLEKLLNDRDATATPDGRSYYGYHRTYEVYFEVIDYAKLLSDAKKRNRIFFERLKL